MALITYPLNNLDYSAEDAELFNCPRTSGVYSGNNFPCTVTGADNTVTVGTGICWIRNSQFSGKVAALKSAIALDLGLPDSVHPRIDAVVIRFDANRNGTEVIVKHGTAASDPSAPDVIRTEAVYELHLYHVHREAGAASISAADLTDLRLDASYCGLMADSVTHVDTNAINNQAIALIEKLRGKLASVENETYYAQKAYVDTSIEAIKTTAVPATLASDGWQGASAPYTQTIQVEGLEDTKRAMVFPAYGSDTDANLAMKEACGMVSFADRSGSSMTFTCLEEKPSVDISVIVEVYV